MRIGSSFEITFWQQVTSLFDRCNWYVFNIVNLAVDHSYPGESCEYYEVHAGFMGLNLCFEYRPNGLPQPEPTNNDGTDPK